MTTKIVFEISDSERPPAGAWSKVWLQRVIGDAHAIGATGSSVTSTGHRLQLTITFPTAASWRVFRDGSCITRALCSVPDPVRGLEIYHVVEVDPPAIQPHRLRVRLRDAGRV